VAYLIYAVGLSAIGALSLNLLIGFWAQITFARVRSSGLARTQEAFSAMRAGADCHFWVPRFSVLVSMLVGLPALRLRGLYFAISTLAAQFILSYLFKILVPWTNGVSGLVVKQLSLFGRPIASDQEYAVICVALLFLSWAFIGRVMQTNVGRAFLVVRESELVARGMGIDVSQTKLKAFLLSGFFAGLCGGLFAFTSRLERHARHWPLGRPDGDDHCGRPRFAGRFALGAAFVTPAGNPAAWRAIAVSRSYISIPRMAFGPHRPFLLLEPRGLVALARAPGARREVAWSVRPAPEPWSCNQASPYPHKTGGNYETTVGWLSRCNNCNFGPARAEITVCTWGTITGPDALVNGMTYGTRDYLEYLNQTKGGIAGNNRY
jgi:branched-chain amino acid transport system permease protein